MKEVGYFRLTLTRWGTYYLLLSFFQQMALLAWPNTTNPAWWATMLGALLMAVAIPFAYGQQRSRKVFIQDGIKT